MKVASEEAQNLDEGSDEEAQNLDERSDEEAQIVDERSDEEAQIVDERSDEETQIVDERSDEETQIVDEMSDEEAQILDEMSDLDLKQYNGIDFDKLTVEEIKGHEFNKVEDAESFFFAYAKAMGFSVRKDEQRWSSKAPRVNIRRWVCSAQGERSVGKTIKVRAPKPLSRFNCPCLFRVKYCKKKDLYVVVAFVAEHSHTLAQAHECHLLRSHRSVPDSHFALAASLRRVSVKTCHAYEHMADKVGGFSKLSFTLKDLYNKMYSKRREFLLENDSETALAYLDGKFATDSGMFCYYNLDEENRLANLFWRDSQSLLDYSCFGDVLLFDSTYKTNVYGKPLVLFVGSNNHLSTVIFGFALLHDETSESYKWVLETFLRSMGGKKPIAVLTDGDEAMRNAIEEELPGVRHRLCTWHISRNARDKLRNNEALSKFRKCMWADGTRDDFERRWSSMVRKFRLKDNDWINMMYRKRHKWAEAYISGHFFARMRSTQRCEGMNSFVKGYIDNGLKLSELIPALDRALARLRNKVVTEDFQSNNFTHPLTTRLEQLEEHSSKVFTNRVFRLVRSEIEEVGALITSNIVKYEYSHVYTSVLRKKNKEYEFKTSYFKEVRPRILCSCKLFEREGIPCSHSFNVMKHERMSEIPDCLIMKRWTKQAKSHVQAILPKDNVSSEALQIARHGDLSCLSNKLSYIASMTNEGTDTLKNEFVRLEPILDGILKKHQVSTPSTPSPTAQCKNIIKDPIGVRSKGMQRKGDQPRPKKQRKCSVCKNYGHKKTTCLSKKRRENDRSTRLSDNENTTESESERSNNDDTHARKRLKF